MAERPKETKFLDLARGNPDVDIELKTSEKQDERASRLRREEAESEHKIRTEQSEDSHKRRIELIVHLFAMTVLAIAFLASLYIAAFSQKNGMPEKAMTIIAGIAGAVGGYLTGKKSK